MILEQYLIEVIVGMVSVVGALIMILNRFGLIQLGKKKENGDFKMKTCPVHEKIANSHTALSKGQTSLVESQKNLSDKLVAINDNQIRNMQLHKQHGKSFDDGSIKMEKMATEITRLCVGVAVLLDRTPGGQVKDFLKLDIHGLADIIKKGDM